MPIVVKVGTSSLALPAGGVDPLAVARITGEIREIRDAGHPCALVTSGAVAAGLPALGLGERPSDIPSLQAAAAVGQGKLMEEYTRAFAVEGLQVGQVLLTRDILSKREQYLNARMALERLLALGIVPIINENDSVVVDELRLGDNDRLAAIVSHLVSAGLLIILTDTTGLYSSDPRLSDTAQLLTAVRYTDEVLDALGDPMAKGVLRSGGAATKVAAARMAAWSGIPTVIAAAREDDVVGRARRGEDVGTWIEPRESRLSARKLWIAFGMSSNGVVHVDKGAAAAIVERGSSLLTVGVAEIEGDFVAGSAVEVHAPSGLIAKGIVSLGAFEVNHRLGQRGSAGELIHRDDMVVLV